MSILLHSQKRVSQHIYQALIIQAGISQLMCTKNFGNGSRSWKNGSRFASKYMDQGLFFSVIWATGPSWLKVRLFTLSQVNFFCPLPFSCYLEAICMGFSSLNFTKFFPIPPALIQCDGTYSHQRQTYLKLVQSFQLQHFISWGILRVTHATSLFLDVSSGWTEKGYFMPKATKLWHPIEFKIDTW